MKVDYIDHMGSDLSVVNAARVSFDKESRLELQGVDEFMSGATDDIPYLGLSKADIRLIQFLARGITAEAFAKFEMELVKEGYLGTEHFIKMLWEWRRTPEHFAPFAHPHVTFRIKAPIFVARQLGKHQVGMVWSEVSRRYVDGEPEFFVPEVWRKRAENVKQGSSDGVINPYEVITDYEHGWFKDLQDILDCVMDDQKTLYRQLLDAGVCPEQARMVLPQSMMTEWIWTGSLYGWANVYNKRKQGSHAQRECWPIAEQLATHMGKLFPVSWAALTGVTGG